MGDMQRAIGLGVQTVPGTPATPIWLNYVEEYGHKPNITFDVPKFKTNQRWMERKIIAKTRFDEVTISGRVDTKDLALMLNSAYGTPTGGVYKAGSSNSKLLTATWYDGIAPPQYAAAVSWSMIDSRVNSWEMNIDAANGTVTYSATLRGVQALPGGAVTPTFTVPPGQQPFGSWQAVLRKGATPFCIHSFRMTINNNFEPYFCTPTVTPTILTEAGLYPSRFTEGEVTGTYDMVYEYTGETDSSFYDYRHQIMEAWTITLTDTTNGGSVLIDLPILGATSGELDRSRPNVLQHTSGAILFDPITNTGSTITIVDPV